MLEEMKGFLVQEDGQDLQVALVHGPAGSPAYPKPQNLNTKP